MELSAYYDITHGIDLAILTPHWMRYVLSDKTVDKFGKLYNAYIPLKEEDAAKIYRKSL